MTATDRLVSAALAVVAANERIHSLRVRKPCEQYEPAEDRYPGVIACRESGDPEIPNEYWCEPCRQRAEAAPSRRIAMGERREAMARLLTAARSVRRDAYVGLPGERARCSKTTQAFDSRRCSRVAAPGDSLCWQHAEQREQDAAPRPLYHCSECGQEKSRPDCASCGTFGNPATNEARP